MVTDITKDGVHIVEKFIPAVTKMWCAGVSMFDWMWSYFTYQRGARLITDHGVQQDVDLKIDDCEARKEAIKSVPASPSAQTPRN